MNKISSILIGIIISTALLLASGKYYAAGSQFNKSPIEYGWKNSYLINSLGESAVNEPENARDENYTGNIIPFCGFSFFGF